MTVLAVGLGTLGEPLLDLSTVDGSGPGYTILLSLEGGESMEHVIHRAGLLGVFGLGRASWYKTLSVRS